MDILISLAIQMFVWKVATLCNLDKRLHKMICNMKLQMTKVNSVQM